METLDEGKNTFLLDEQITSNYRIVRQLGRGAMGSVFLAEQIHVGRRLVALKVLNREAASNPQVIKRFESEAATAGLIHHRNVVTIYESRMTGSGHLYVAMEYVNGHTLREELARRAPLPLEEVIGITRQICAGLAAAHKVGIVHRDIKPDNLMLVADDEGLTVKILDFGIARLSEPTATSMQTQPGLIIGTPAYLSPEQAAGAIGNQIDARSDLYSLGMVVYEMLTGRVAFDGDSWLSVVRKQMYDLPAAPNQMAAGLNLPVAIEQVVMQTLEKDREKRPLSAAAFARELERAYVEAKKPPAQNTEPLAQPAVVPTRQAAVPSTEVTPTIIPSVDIGHLPRQPDNRWKMVAGLSILVLCAVITGLWLTKKTPPENASSASPIPPSTSTSPVTNAPAIKRDILTYRVTRKIPVGGLATLPLDLTVKTNERIVFGFQPSQAGTIYLMLENDDHSWRWFDATATGLGTAVAANRQVELPPDQWYVLDDKAGVEKFWLLYVPDGINWSLATTIAPEPISVEARGKWEGTAAISPAAVEKILGWFKGNGLSLKATGQQSSNQVSFQLWQESEEKRAAFHLIELNHTP